MKRCIFCKLNSESSKSVEHIIPESLGNVNHILPKGIVCDKCNNYFSIKIEKPLLEKPYFKNLRYRNIIESKKGRLTPNKTLFPHPKGGWIDMWIDDKGIILKKEDIGIIDLIKSGEIKSLIIPIIPIVKENDKIVSRFLAKVALEALAHKWTESVDWINEITDKTELNPLREYARYGKGKFWKYSQRRIYGEEDRFTDPINNPEPYEILHEMDFLYLKNEILYFVLVIMGVEYVINLGASEIELYEKWLLENNEKTPIRRFSEYMIERNKEK